jgi:hypothetical protein
MKIMMRSRKNRLNLLIIAAFSLLSMSCGLINRALDAVTDSGLEKLKDIEVVDQIITAMEMAEGKQIDWTELEVPGSEFLFEVDPFEDVIRWRFYAIKDELADAGEFYINLLPNFLIERDQQVNDHRYLVLSAGHTLSSIYSKEQLQELRADYQQLPSTLLDVEVLHSTAHRDSGRLAITEGMGALPGEVPENTTIVILVYNFSSAGWEDIQEIAPGIVSNWGDDKTPTDPEEMTNGDDIEQNDTSDDEDDGLGFNDDEIIDPSGFCDQVLGSGVCYHPYIPVVEGFTRSYQTEDGITTETISEVRNDGFTLTTEMPDGTTNSSEFQCGDEGITGWVMDDSMLEMMAEEHDLFTDIEVEGSALPHELSPGVTWQVTVNATIGIRKEGVESSNEIVMNFEYTVVGEETISTPAGRFTAIRVDFTGTGENNLVITGPGPGLSQLIATLESNGSEWYVPCVGKVRSYTSSTWSGIVNVESEIQMEINGFGLR